MDGGRILVLEPDKELQFRRPFSSVTKQTLELRNDDSEWALAFKVKTTAPKQYCVRPNAGRLQPGERCEVSVLLQAMKDDTAAVRSKDKFQ
eukprot:jgi/Hompol1/3591/HPOL_006631-RA